MIAAGPGIPAGIESRLVLNVDIPPTILELAGLPVPDATHGDSLLPLLRSEAAAWRRSFLYEAPTPSLGSRPLMAVRTDRWKCIQTFDPNDPDRLTFEELYDLQTDPHETENLAGRPESAARQAALRVELDRLRTPIRA
jgi:arylsulfatase A-like enzyme